MQHFLGEAGKLAEEHRAEEPHPADAQQRAEHHDVAVRELEVAPGFGKRVPVDHQARIGRRRLGNPLRKQPPDQRQRHAGHRHCSVTNLRHGHQQAARHVAQQDGDEGAHLHHAVAAGELTIIERLRQIGKLDRPEQRGMQPHQEHTAQQDGGIAHHKARRRNQHHDDLEILDEADDARLLQLVGDLPGGGREQQKRQDEQRADHQPRHGRRHPAHAELVSHHHGERELEEVVVGRARELRPEERCKAPLPEQRELVGVLLVRIGTGDRTLVNLR
ncbi:hypothetical protein SDC9_156561 [bioreactor metagenome]|uniref:Uncharacterized protein n=1 Tax=bioreactor metagenome TaxID=1076179 RepID=A0A645F6W8_9ZZZZ